MSIMSCSKFSFSKCQISHLSWALASCHFMLSVACSSSSDCCQLASHGSEIIESMPNHGSCIIYTAVMMMLLSCQFFLTIPSLAKIFSNIFSFFKFFMCIFPIRCSSLAPTLHFLGASSSWNSSATKQCKKFGLVTQVEVISKKQNFLPYFSLNILPSCTWYVTSSSPLFLGLWEEWLLWRKHINATIWT